MNFLKIGVLIFLLYFGFNLIFLLNKHFINPYHYEKDYCLVSKNINGCYTYSVLNQNNICLTLHQEVRDCSSYDDYQLIECWRFEWNFQAPKCIHYFFEMDVKEDIKRIDDIFFNEFERYMKNIAVCLFILNISKIFRKGEPKVLLYVPEDFVKQNKNIFEFNGEYYQIKNKVKTH